MGASARDVETFFERVAADRDDMRLAYYDERVIEEMMKGPGAGGDTTVADVGTGFVAAGIAPRVGRVVAVDNSSAMLDVARENLAALGLDNVELVEGEISALPLRGSSVGAAFANMVLHHAGDPVAVLREMARIFEPGGTVAVVDAVEHTYGWMREEHADIRLGFGRGQMEGFFGSAGLASFGYEALGAQ